MNNLQSPRLNKSNTHDLLMYPTSRASKCKHTVYLRTVIFSLVLTLIAISCIGSFSSCADDSDIGEWVVLESDKNIVEKQKIGLAGSQYSLYINYNSYNGELPVQPKKDKCAEMIGQWLISLGTFDYSQHFPLFAEEFLNDYLYVEFAELGLTPKDAAEKIAQVAKDTTGVSDCRIEYYVLDIKNSTETLQKFKDNHSERFEKVGLDVNKIEEVCEYVIEDIKIYWNNTFVSGDSDFDFDEYTLYKYNGKWYLSPYMLDDDLSLDLAESNVTEARGYYKENHTSGEVTGIENGYLILSDTNYFWIGDNYKDLTVGDYVDIKYYSAGASLKRISDGKRCDVGVAVTIDISDESLK